MSSNKEQLQKLLDFIHSITKQQGNEWFVAELFNQLSYSENSSQSKIDNIYEYCVEKIIREQAVNFYKDFPITEIKSQLIEDYIRMEHFKKKNNFEDFCLALYQQIENITNKIVADASFREVYSKLLHYSAYADGEGYARADKPYTIAKLLFSEKFHLEKSKQDVTTLYAIDKIRSVIYFVYYKGRMRNTDYNEFVNITDLINSLYQYRNKNHRGSVLNDYQKTIIEKVEPKKYQYYFKYLSVLVSFVEKIEAGFPISNDLLTYCKSLPNKSAQIEMPTIINKIELSEQDRNKKRFK
jgi:hypothetical protein